MSLYKIFLAVTALVLLLGCSQNNDFLNIPKKGDYSGIVIDNLTEQPLSGFEVSASFVLPDNNTGQEVPIRTTTNTDGIFILTDLWDDVRIEFTKTGFQTVVKDINISRLRKEDKELRKDDPDYEQLDVIGTLGMPTVSNISILNSEPLSIQNNDTTKVQIEIADGFNLNEGTSSAALVLYDLSLENQPVVKSYNMEVFVSSVFFDGLSTIVKSTDFPPLLNGETTKEYGIIAEISDPDGNGNSVDYGSMKKIIIAE